MTAKTHPIVLIDWPDEGLDEYGWVSTDASMDEAGAALVPMLTDTMVLDTPTRVWLRITTPSPWGNGDGETWTKCEPTDEGAREFWQFEAMDPEDAAALEGNDS